MFKDICTNKIANFTVQTRPQWPIVASAGCVARREGRLRRDSKPLGIHVACFRSFWPNPQSPAASPRRTRIAPARQRGRLVRSSGLGGGCHRSAQHPRRLGLYVGRCSRLKRAALKPSSLPRPVGRLARPAGRPRPAEGYASPSALSASPLCCS